MQILERLGHHIDYPEELTCCGQPAFNSGYWDETRPIVERVLNRLKDAEAVVIASGSCGAMIKKFYPELFANTPHAGTASELAARCYEFSDFLVTKLGITELGARFPHRVTRQRLETYERETEPLLNHYSGDLIVEVDASKSPIEVLGAIVSKVVGYQAQIPRLHHDRSSTTSSLSWRTH